MRRCPGQRMGCGRPGMSAGAGQIMADTLVERVTGQASADRVPVEVQLVITDRSLFRNPAPGTRTARTGHPKRPERPEYRPGRAGAPEAGVSGVLVAPGMSGATGTPGAPGIPASNTSIGSYGPSLATTAHRDTPAHFPGYGIVPGVWRRQLAQTPRWIPVTCREASSDTESSRRDAPDTAPDRNRNRRWDQQPAPDQPASQRSGTGVCGESAAPVPGPAVRAN